ncbi:MAG: hypothetical protein HFI09_04700 [Bacilli bacterium]|nr:hypothetical protein [Bacilli bacterium]
MEKITELQQKLILALQKEERLLEEMLKSPTKDRSKIKRCQRKIKQIHQEIFENVTGQKEDLKEKISQNLWEEAQLQNYFGVYQNQKSPYTIFDIAAIDYHTVLIQAGYTQYFKARHRNPNNDLIHNSIILKDTPNGLFRYNEQKLETKDQPTDITTKASLKLKDPNRNIYIFHIQECLNENIKIEAKIDRYRYGLYLFKRDFLRGKITSEDLEQFTEKINQVEFDYWNNREYFKYLKQESKSIDLLKETTKAKKRTF